MAMVTMAGTHASLVVSGPVDSCFAASSVMKLRILFKTVKTPVAKLSKQKLSKTKQWISMDRKAWS